MAQNQYGISRNVKKSTLEFIQDVLRIACRTDVTAIYESKRDTETPMPNVTVQLSNNFDKSVECGDTLTVRDFLVIVDVRAKDDADKLDLSDLLYKEMKGGWYYNKYESTEGAISGSHRKGRLDVITRSNTPVDLQVEKSRLAISDQHRQRLTFRVSPNIIE